MASSGGEIKVNSSKSRDIVNGNSTDVVCYNFANRIFILLTQFQRPGTMVIDVFSILISFMPCPLLVETGRVLYPGRDTMHHTLPNVLHHLVRVVPHFANFSTIPKI